MMPSRTAPDRSAKPFRAVRDLETAAKATNGRIPKAKRAPDPGSPVARAQRAAKRAKDEGDLSQAEKFEKAAADLGGDFDDDKLMGVLRSLAKPKSAAR